jgi:hypothetical protein
MTRVYDLSGVELAAEKYAEVLLIDFWRFMAITSQFRQLVWFKACDWMFCTTTQEGGLEFDALESYELVGGFQDSNVLTGLSKCRWPRLMHFRVEGGVWQQPTLERFVVHAPILRHLHVHTERVESLLAVFVDHVLVHMWSLEICHDGDMDVDYMAALLCVVCPNALIHIRSREISRSFYGIHATLDGKHELIGEECMAKDYNTYG